LATNRNISDDILLAVAMNGLKPELKTIVMTKEYCLYIDNQVSTFCVLSPLNFSIFKFDAVLKILKF
jgi:hypothetical protein